MPQPGAFDNTKTRSALKARQAARDSRPRPWLANSVLLRSWDSTSQDLPDPVSLPSPELPIIRYLDAPFRVQHYFLKFLQANLQECCFEYAQHQLRAELESPLWRMQNLPQFLDGKRKPWMKPGLTELTDWTNLFAHSFGLPGIVKPDYLKWKRMLSCVEEIRHRFVHREQIDVDTIRTAMKLPSVLHDEERGKMLEGAYKVLFERHPSYIPQETQRAVNEALYEPTPLLVAPDLLGRVQDLLEQSCFIYRRRDSNSWGAPRISEQIELKNYQESWSGVQDTKSQREEFFPDTKGFLFTRTLCQIRELRNGAAHRADFTKWETFLLVKDAIVLANLVDDRINAVEIEILAEEWLTSSSRTKVLVRLREAFMDNECTAANTNTEEGTRNAIRERRRRFAVAKAVICLLPKFKDAKHVSRFLRRRSNPPVLVMERHVPSRPTFNADSPPLERSRRNEDPDSHGHTTGVDDSTEEYAVGDNSSDEDSAEDNSTEGTSADNITTFTSSMTVFRTFNEAAPPPLWDGPGRVISLGEAEPEETMVDRREREWNELHIKLISRSMHMIFKLDPAEIQRLDWTNPDDWT